MVAVNKADTLDAADLEELLDAELPCGGHHGSGPCGRSAVLHSRGHGCQPPTAAFFKCTECWMVWYRIEANRLDWCGQIRCRECEQVFYDIDSFSHYRPI